MNWLLLLRLVILGVLLFCVVEAAHPSNTPLATTTTTTTTTSSKQQAPERTISTTIRQGNDQEKDRQASPQQDDESSRQQQQQHWSSVLARTSEIAGESALVDGESGQVYWQESGLNPMELWQASSSSLSLWARRNWHLRATLLSVLLWMHLLSNIRIAVENDWFRQALAQREAAAAAATAPPWFASLVRTFLSWFLVLTRPLSSVQWERWFVVLLVVLYLGEAATCSTVQYLQNVEAQLERYLEQLRQAPALVTWTVRNFHYQPRPLWNPFATGNHRTGGSHKTQDTPPEKQQQEKKPTNHKETVTPNENDNQDQKSSWFAFSSWNDKNKTTSQNGQGQEQAQETPLNNNNNNNEIPSGNNRWTRKKVISFQSRRQYTYPSWNDRTFVSVWKQAPSFVWKPLTKVTLTKMVVLANVATRRDYFQQQASFVREEGQTDQYAEFATQIEVPEFRSKVLAVRQQQHLWGARLLVFWLLTLLGFTVPYRIWLARHCDEIRVTLVKETTTTTTTTASRGESWLSSAWSSILKGRQQQEEGALDKNTNDAREWNGRDELVGREEAEYRKRMEELYLYTSRKSQELEETNHRTATAMAPEPVATDKAPELHPQAEAEVEAEADSEAEAKTEIEADAKSKANADSESEVKEFTADSTIVDSLSRSSSFSKDSNDASLEEGAIEQDRDKDEPTATTVLPNVDDEASGTTINNESLP